MNNKGQFGTAGSWVFGIIIISVTGLAFVIFNHVLTDYILPVNDVIMNQSTLMNSSMQQASYDENTRFMAFWNFVPLLLFIIVILWMIITAIRTREENV